MGVALGVGGVVMSVLYVLSCDIERVIQLYNGEVPPNAARVKYGFLSRAPITEEEADYMACKWYPSDEKELMGDAWMKSAKMFLFISTILGIVGCAVLCAALCVAFTPHTFAHWLMWNYLIAAIAIPLSYLIFGSSFCSDNDCKLGEGGVQAISIFLFWLCAANTVKGFPEAIPDPDKEEGDVDDLYYATDEDMWNDRAPANPDEYDDDNYDEYDDADEYDEDGRRRAGTDYQAPYSDDQGHAAAYPDIAGGDVYKQEKEGDSDHQGSHNDPQQVTDKDYLGSSGSQYDDDYHGAPQDDYFGGEQPAEGGYDHGSADPYQQQDDDGDNFVIDDNNYNTRYEDDDEVKYPEQNLPRVGEHDDSPTIA